MSFWNKENRGDLKMENRKNHADLLQALREYRCGMVRRVGQGNKNQNTEDSGKLQRGLGG